MRRPHGSRRGARGCGSRTALRSRLLTMRPKWTASASNSSESALVRRTSEAGTSRLPYRSREESVMPIHDHATSRRRFLQFLAASPLLAGSDLAAIAAERPSLLPDPMLWGPRTLEKLISSPKEAINVFDFEDRKSTRLNSSHLGISYAVFCLKK